MHIDFSNPNSMSSEFASHFVNPNTLNNIRNQESKHNTYLLHERARNSFAFGVIVFLII